MKRQINEFIYDSYVSEKYFTKYLTHIKKDYEKILYLIKQVQESNLEHKDKLKIIERLKFLNIQLICSFKMAYKSLVTCNYFNDSVNFSEVKKILRNK